MNFNGRCTAAASWPESTLQGRRNLRRAEDLDSGRLARLDALLAGSRRKPPALEEIIDALTHPLLDRSARGRAGWKSHFALIAEINNSPGFGGVLMTKHFDPVVQRLIEAIRRASDLDSVHERLAPFRAAGFRALCARDARRRKVAR